ncbi:PucR family transcriptional regulator [Streptomyces celluloflavus]|uniref:PucR family transcriptional regulator n=1 Tax=Streptomyces celluloflavus TaxID=58344 RepID=A0ABW7RSU1_9ACTN|nr:MULTISPECIES: helix-turn-helix domain-containing protein [Streptomyces]MYU52857.1 PucR family transcriptional regulator [Streptomyces sp. SID7805]WSK15752.1 helix-turn-helix domain-containing protein [Streptomyces celluloflavus]
MSDQPRAVLGRILSDLGTTLIEVVAGEADPARAISGVLIQDPLDEPARLPGAVVLGVGVYGAEPVAALVERAAGLGAAAVVVRSPVPVDGPVARAAERTGLTVLGLTRGASWAQVAALLRSLLAVDELGTVGGVGEAGGGEPLAGDLFALANATAGLLGGPVTVEDRSGRVLAFSNWQEEGDDDRIATILDRQVSAEKLRLLEVRGAFHALYRSEGPVYLDGLSAKPRVAIAVRAGGEILGSIWVVVDGPLSEDRTQALHEAAKVAALHLLRQRTGLDAERRLRADLLATVLEGGAHAPQAAVRLGLSAQPACVLALAVTGEPSAPDRVAAGHRVAEALSLHLSAIHPRTAAAALGGATYAVLPTSSDEQALRVAEAFLGRIGSRVPAVIGIGRLAARPGELRRSRADADRALRVLGSGRSPRRAARLSDVYAASLLEELTDRMAAEDDLPDGPVVRLRAYDAQHHTALTETLAAWLSTFGDVIAASAAVHVHPNTFRYRLKRLAVVAGLDLNDPEARFEAMLQLRLRAPGA